MNWVGDTVSFQWGLHILRAAWTVRILTLFFEDPKKWRVQMFSQGHKISPIFLTLVGNFKKRLDIFFNFCGLPTISGLYGEFGFGMACQQR